LDERLRFHLDENVYPAIGQALRRRGVDTTTTAEAGLCQATDHQQLAFALREGRVVFTHDFDFLELASTGLEHCGIAYCYWNPRRRPTEILAELIRLWQTFTPQQMRNRIEYL
jgi:hypothetical protein